MEWAEVVEYSFCKMDCQCRRELVTPRRFVGWCAGGQWLPSLYQAADADAWARHFFLKCHLLPSKIRAHKAAPKI
jgi:hypothetical protein